MGEILQCDRCGSIEDVGFLNVDYAPFWDVGILQNICKKCADKIYNYVLFPIKDYHHTLKCICIDCGAEIEVTKSNSENGFQTIEKYRAGCKLCSEIVEIYCESITKKVEKLNG